MKQKQIILVILIVIISFAAYGEDLEKLFRDPPGSFQPWIFWHWNNGNVTKDGITKDLEGMKRVGIGGVILFRISGPSWAPAGPLKTGIENQLPMIKWAANEAKRLGIIFSLVVDYGYGSGGPHITPDISMQQFYRSETTVRGGSKVKVKLPKPDYRKNEAQMLKKAKLRPGTSLSPKVSNDLAKINAYRDITVFAIPAGQKGGIQKLELYNALKGLGNPKPLKSKSAALPRAKVIDLSGKMDSSGNLNWDAPQGEWTVYRLGYACNYKLTRPSPSPEVGLECDRLHRRGIEKHFEHRLKPVLEELGGKELMEYIFIDSWEADSQNWTEGFAGEFQKRHGYDPLPWLPVLTGHLVESKEKSERFLWDLRHTVSEVMLTNYIGRLSELLEPYGTKLFFEPYGKICVDSFNFAALTDFPVGEFWTSRKLPKTPGLPASIDKWCYNTMKGLASVANTYGRSRVGAEAFTGGRGWSDHPWLIKGVGDEAYCQGISHYVFHLSVHQPYDRMKPGFTHRKWGEHFQRHQTWWEYSKPYMTYVARCHALLQQGLRIVDVACLYNEGAPLNFKSVKYTLPAGYDYDICTPQIIAQMTVKDGRLIAPSGARYRYLHIVPERLTLTTAQKIEALRQAGAKIYTSKPIQGTPGLTDYQTADKQVKKLSAKWPILPQEGWKKVFAMGKCLPDFEGGGVKYIHRRTAGSDIYFIANTAYQGKSVECVFRTADRIPELWDPETGTRFSIPHKRLNGGRTAISIKFGPADSWFVVFRKTSSALVKNPFPDWKELETLSGPWSLSFDSQWGTEKTLKFRELQSWTEHSEPLVKYYSGTATYRGTFTLKRAPEEPVYLDLGRVEVMAQVFINDKDCGITWKPPHRVNITAAVKTGENKLKIRVVNTWNNRLIGDEHLELDAPWKSRQSLANWPEWFLQGKKSPTGRYTFTTTRHYRKDSPLQTSGLLGPVKIVKPDF